MEADICQAEMPVQKGRAIMLGLIIFCVILAIVSYVDACIHQETVRGCRSMAVFGAAVAVLGGLGVLDMTILNPAQYGWGSWITAVAYIVCGTVMFHLALLSVKYRLDEE